MCSARSCGNSANAVTGPGDKNDLLFEEVFWCFIGHVFCRSGLFIVAAQGCLLSTAQGCSGRAWAR